MEAAPLDFAAARQAVAPRSQRGSQALAVSLMAASGFAGLGYQIVWTQQAAVWLGHESAAVLAVVAAFFGGLALGAGWLGARLQRSAHAGRGYALCELVIGAWSLVLAGAMAPAGRWLLELTGPAPSPLWQWSLAFGGTFLLLLPATLAMGATLPAIERVTAGWRDRGTDVGPLYAGNTAGAVVGVLAAAFWLVPAYGLSATALGCAALNALCAVLAWRLFPPTEAGVRALPRPPMAAGRPAAASTAALPWMLACTGLLGIGYEVLAVRVLRQVAENTVYTFAMLLAVYLVGTALGAAAWARRPLAGDDPAALQARLLRWLAAACLLGTVALGKAPQVKAGVLQALGPGLGSALMAEAALAVLAFGLPTLLMGALFVHLVQQALVRGMDFGRALAVNTLGSALAAPVFGMLLAPWLGPQGALSTVAAGYLALAFARGPRPAPAWALAAALAGLAVAAPPLAFVTVPEGGRVVSYREGAMAAVSVVADADGVLRLRIDNRQQEGSSATALADGRQALIPLLLHPAPRHALFLGLGTGVTAATAALDPALQVRAVELLPEVVQASRLFAGVVGTEAAARVQVTVADARRQVRADPARYDLIVADNFHPARSGSAALYTAEHFQAVRERLAPGGLFCQWLPLHQMDLATLRSVVASFLVAYPGAWAVLATNSLETPTVGLVGRADGLAFDPAQWRQRLATAALARPPAAYGLGEEWALAGSFIGGPASLARFAAGAPVNTDDRPVVAYLAPRNTYAPASWPRERLFELLHQLGLTPAELAGARVEPVWGARLTAYWAARDQFLAAGRQVQPTGSAREMLAQVREPLLAVLRTSPDFRPAYEPLLHLGSALAGSDPAGARALLAELARLQPRWPDAGQRLNSLAPPPAAAP